MKYSTTSAHYSGTHLSTFFCFVQVRKMIKFLMLAIERKTFMHLVKI